MRANTRYLKFLVIILTMITVFPCAGFGATPGKPGEITASGVVKKQGVTAYMYGTHVLLDDDGKTLYALKSDSVDLDRHTGRKATIRGVLVKGYPLDSGPQYLDVISIE